MAAATIAAATGGTLVGPDVEVDGATIDSRRVRAGNLFVPVVAARDGHDFIGDALAAGAVAYLTSSPVQARQGGQGADEGAATAIVVADTATALADLGRWARSRLPDRVVGITGSTGKTSTKDLLTAVLGAQGPCAASERSHNNELGVPLTLVNAPDDAGAAVVEMGARDAFSAAALRLIAERPRSLEALACALAADSGAAKDLVYGRLSDVFEALRHLGLAEPVTTCDWES